MALTKTPIELSSTPSIVDGGNATAITIDSSENVTLAGTLSSGAITSSGNISLGGSDGDNAVLTLAANTGNWVFTNVQANRNLEISDSDGTGTVLTIATDGDFFLNTTSAMANCFASFQDGNNGEAMFGISAKNDSNVGIRLGVGTDRKWVMYRNTSDDLIFYNNASSGERVRFLDAGGIAFNGDTATANALDDYEEGTWTPVLKGYYGNTGLTATQGSVSGYYTKIGRLVNIRIHFDGAGIAASGNSDIVAIGGLPFVATNGYEGSGPFIANAVNLTQSHAHWNIIGASEIAMLGNNGSGGGWAWQTGVCFATSGVALRISMTYATAT